MTRGLVVSAFNDPCSWALDIQADKRYIHWKNQGGTLPNVGREGHTILYHIVEYWEELEDIMIFTQDNPEDHRPGFVGVVNSVLDEEVFSKGYVPLSNHSEVVPPYISSARYVFRDAFGVDIRNQKYLMNCNSMFMVTRETIHRWPLNGYKQLLGMVKHGDLILEIYTMEAIWSLLFGYPTCLIPQ